MSALDRFRRRGAGPGAPLLTLATALQVALLVRLATLPPPPAPSPEPLGLAAAAVVEPGDGRPPAALLPGSVQADGSRLQITFEADHDAWVSVLWFEGPDRVVSLYPRAARNEEGWVAKGTTYVVPSASSYLRLTPTTSPEGDWMAVVAASRPDPRIEAVLADPDPAAVASLRSELMDAARARTSDAGSVERFLPTADGRAVAVRWEQVRGFGRLVYGRSVRVAPRGLAYKSTQPAVAGPGASTRP